MVSLDKLRLPYLNAGDEPRDRFLSFFVKDVLAAEW